MSMKSFTEPINRERWPQQGNNRRSLPAQQRNLAETRDGSLRDGMQQNEQVVQRIRLRRSLRAILDEALSIVENSMEQDDSNNDDENTVPDGSAHSRSGDNPERQQ